MNRSADISRLHAAADAARSLLESLDCDYAEVRLSQGISTDIVLSGRVTDNVSSGESTAGSVRVLKNGSWGFVSFNDLESISRHVKAAVETVGRERGGAKSSVALSPAAELEFITPVAEPLYGVTLDEKFSIIDEYNRILNSSPAVQTTRAVYRDFVSTYVFLNTAGSRLTWEKSYCGVGLTAVAKDGTLIQPYGNSTSGYGGFELVRGKHPFAENVARTAVSLLTAETVAGGRYDVIIDQKLAGVFIHEAFGHLSEADFIYENPRMAEQMKLGREFGPETLNVYDQGDFIGEAGYIPFDDEGVIPGKTALITAGVLSGRLHSRETAAKMNEPLTGNGRAVGVTREPIVRMTTTHIDNGPSAADDLFAAVEDGLYAKDYVGGQTDLEMFTFSPACAYRIKNGKAAGMVRDIVLSGNLFTTLKSISMIANDRKIFSGLGGCGKGGQSPLPVSFGGPHILFKNLLVGGRA